MDEAVAVLALVGLAPAVASETIWALAKAGRRPVSVTLIATAAGAAEARVRLIEGGGLASAAEPWPAPSVRLIVIEGRDGPLDDVRGPSDHLVVVDAIDALVRAAVAPDAPPLHASLAGGRKTMAAALTWVMSLRARPQDVLSHVLVDGPGASDPDWLHPTGDDDPTRVHLIETPFARLRPLLGAAAGPDGPPARDLLSLAIERIEAATPATLDLGARLLRRPDGEPVRLRPIQAALLACLIAAGPDGLDPRTLDLAALADAWRLAGARPDRARVLIERLTRYGADDWLREHLARLRAALAGSSIAIVRVGARPASRHALAGRGVVLEPSHHSGEPAP